MDTDPVGGLTATTRSGATDRLTLFAVMWAAVTLFHVWGGSARATAVFSDPSGLAVMQAVSGAVAVAVLLWPRRLELLGALAVLGIVTLWMEMPVAGSHWMVAGLVDVALLLCVVSSRDVDVYAARFFVLARWVLIGFYSFAAFAKLNHAFFTPEVSCGTYYFDELAGSLHLTVHSQAGGWWTHLVLFGVAATELSVPILLLIRRTRHLGVLVGLVFHGLIALDQTHLFADFSSVLTPLFVAFLPPFFAVETMSRIRALDPDRRDLLRVLAAGGSFVVLLAQWFGKGSVAERVFVDGRAWVWVIFDVIVVGLVVSFLWRRRPEPIVRPLSGIPAWMWIVPALVLFQGLAPYLEVRTAYAFNMYSNLQTADGDSNHFIVTKTLPLTDYQSDLVRIVSTNDAGLQGYVTQHFDIPFFQLRDYLSHHPGAALTYVRGGVERHVEHASDDPALVEPVPGWQAKVFAFRSLDQTQPNRCQPAFLPAL